jgi:hypothetical protein
MLRETFSTFRSIQISNKNFDPKRLKKKPQVLAENQAQLEQQMIILKNLYDQD